MTLRIVGAGLGRTGTHSLKLALEQLLSGRCYHMLEVFDRQQDIPVWQAAAAGDAPDWNAFLGEYVACVDWPAAAFWQELAEANPDALVLLSERDVDAWWTSCSNTIFSAEMLARYPDPESPGWPHDLIRARFTPRWRDEHEAKSAYLRHNQAVRAHVPAGRLVEWRPGDGWAPICAALGVPVPAEPFPHVNSTAEFRAMLGFDTAG